jgi:endonuclease III
LWEEYKPTVDLAKIFTRNKHVDTWKMMMLHERKTCTFDLPFCDDLGVNLHSQVNNQALKKSIEDVAFWTAQS